jgi:cyclophilin family peptidyl-prolyl cis-trans isomerase
MKKILKKMLCGILAAVSVFGCAASLTACETAKPEVEMTVEFNGESYTLEYVLYRNTAPQTVQHFLWLADNGYYDGLCVHDYEENKRLYTGAYTAAESASDADGLVYKKYFDTIKGYKNYGEFPVSVWADREQTTPTYTLKGEFSKNGVTVESGALKETFGSLTMYYYPIAEESIAEKDVYMLRADDGTASKCDYQYNYTTSMFYISLTSTTITNQGYCTFATLAEDSVEELKSLQEAIKEYTYKEFVDSKTVLVAQDDPLVGSLALDVKVSVPKTPIIIKNVKVTKF